MSGKGNVRVLPVVERIVLEDEIRVDAPAVQ